MAKRWQPQGRDEWKALSRWDAPPYREIETKIGEELREYYKPPQELPYKLLTILMQMGRETEGGGEGGDRSGYA